MTADCGREEKVFKVCQQPYDWVEETVAESDWPFRNGHNQLINKHRTSERFETD